MYNSKEFFSNIIKKLKSYLLHYILYLRKNDDAKEHFR